MIEPSPPHWLQVLAIEKNPCWKRICPLPRQEGQVRGALPLLVPLPAHPSQVFQRGTESCLLAAEHRFLERDLEVVAEVLATPRATARAAAPTTEEVSEDVAEEVFEARAEIESAESALLIERRVTEAIVLRAPLGITEDLIRGRGFLEALLGLPCRRGCDRDDASARGAIGLLDLVLRGLATDAEHLVVVPLGAEASRSMYDGTRPHFPAQRKNGSRSLLFDHFTSSKSASTTSSPFLPPPPCALSPPGAGSTVCDPPAPPCSPSACT